MACKTCGSPNVADSYDCHKCIIKHGLYKWCVITKLNSLALCDDSLSLNREETKEFLGMWSGFRMFDLDSYIERRHKLTKINRDKYFYSYNKQVFEVGEMLPINVDFERELVGVGRSPRKWDVEYRLFDSDKIVEAMMFARFIRDAEYTFNASVKRILGVK